MAKRGIIGTAQGTIADAAVSGAEGAFSFADAAAKATTGAVLMAVKGARRFVAVERPKRRKFKRKVKAAARKTKTVSKRAGKKVRATARRKVAATRGTARKAVGKSARKVKTMRRKR